MKKKIFLIIAMVILSITSVNAKEISDTQKYYCDKSGYDLAGDKCIKSEPAHYRSGSYYCPNGDKPVEKKCITTIDAVINPNYKGDVTEETKCGDGKIFYNNKCYLIIGTPIDYRGYEKCEKGTLVGGVCIMAEDEIIVPVPTPTPEIKPEQGTINTDYTELNRLIQFVKKMYTFVEVIAVVGVVIMGSIEYAKVVIGNPDKDLPKANKSFINKLIAAAIILLMFSIVQFIISSVGKSPNAPDWAACWTGSDKCIINNGK